MNALVREAPQVHPWPWYVECYLHDHARQLALHAVLLALFLSVSVKLAMEKVAFGCLTDLFSQESIKIDYRIERVTEKSISKGKRFTSTNRLK